jgi:hypothetical protein
MRHPAEALAAANRVLKRDGLLVITTPNIDGLFPRVTYRLLAQTIGAWEHPTPPHHLYQFSRRTLGALLDKSGFELVSTKTRPMGLRFTVQQMQSAIIDALKRRTGARAPHRLEAVVEAQPAGPGNSRRPFWSRVPRASVAAFSWSLTAALYAIPVASLGLGDSMIVVARKL